MDAAALRRFSQRTAAHRVELYGVELEFRGETVRGVVTPSDPSVTLQSGGLLEDATWRIRVPATLQPPPKIKERWREPATGRVFVTTGCVPGNSENPIAQEHLVGAQLG